MDTTGNFPKAGGAAADKAAGAVKDGISTAQQGLVQAASAAAGFSSPLDSILRYSASISSRND